MSIGHLLLASVLVLALWTNESSACADVNWYYTGVSLTGGYKKAANWPACGEMCEKDPLCSFWSFLHYDKRSLSLMSKRPGQCILKYFRGDRVKVIGIFSGKKNCKWGKK